MVKGCQRCAVVLRGTGSTLFDEAYFILKPEKNTVTEQQMIEEANRIVRENVFRPRRGRDESFFAARMRCFLLGLLSGAIPVALLWLFFG